MKNYITDTRADYAEMFETLPLFNGAKLQKGISVVLVGDKIRPAQKNEVPFGVISSSPIMIGNSSGKDWSGKYLKDEFGNKTVEMVDIWEKVGMVTTERGTTREKQIGLISKGNIPQGATFRKMKTYKMNPDFDATKPYVERLNRPEWNAVALLGKVKIIKSQPVAPNWIKLKEISDRVDEWLIR